MKRTFDVPELLPKTVIASAMVRRRIRLLLFRADDKREAGYALVTVCSPYGYVLVHALTIYPFLRGQLLDRVAMELIARCYAGKKGSSTVRAARARCCQAPERLLAKNGYRTRARWTGTGSRRHCACARATEGHHARGAAAAAWPTMLPPVNTAHDSAGGVTGKDDMGQSVDLRVLTAEG